MRTLLRLATAALAASAHAADPQSYADTDKFVVRHVALDLRTDFEARRREGTVDLTV
jgi:hypothetical protein